jgi:hydrogenase nickel incorporation protein HypB
METTRIIKVKQSVFANNDARANELRKRLKEKKVFLVNVMSSPGAGKTTLLVDVINRLKKEFRIGVIEADMDAVVDCNTIKEKTGVKTIQLHTSGECHLDAKMVDEGIKFLGEDDLDLVFLENIGNLVCPAEFDTGATLKLVILSIPEGDDKPLKYPLMFKKGDVFIFSKMDALCVFDFSLERAEKEISDLNEQAKFFPLSVKKNEGVETLCTYLRTLVKEY